MDRSFVDELARELAIYKRILVMAIGFSIVLILLSIVSLLVVSPTSSTYYIALVNIVTLLAVILLCGGGIAFCNRYGY